ncbi:MAG TPA: LacI family DNA-binding transcriptional regulator [Armatimonadota bacterium]|nr:LacI family DNA-binding transcriptional regulator [Armatimonadota bacterium]
MATIQDVARLCRVSPATVSYVINNGPRPVHPNTRQRVLEAIRDLEYEPSAVARGLRRKRMDAIGVVFYAFTSLVTNPYFGAILDGILAVAMEKKQNTTLFTGQTLSDARQSLPIFCDGRCDGLLLIAPPTGSPTASGLMQKRIPFVVISGGDADDVSGVDVDNVEATRELTNHLIELGHRRIGALCGPDELIAAVDRRTGFRQALSAAGIALDPAYVRTSNFGKEAGYRSALDLLRTVSPRPTALFCSSDEMAIGALRALSELALRAPDDISIVGFDDIPQAATSDPPLTTVRQPLQLLAECATQMLLEQIQDGAPMGRRLRLPTTLVIRGSTAPLR